MQYVAFGFDFPKCITLHFFTLSLISQVIRHLPTTSKSFRYLSDSICSFKTEIILESFAKSLVMFSILSGRSLMHITKKRCPKTEPWCTPLRTYDHFKLSPPIVILCFIQSKNFSNHFDIP